MKVVWIVSGIIAALIVLFMTTLVIRSYRAQDAAPNLGVDEGGQLKPCPASPNCVSSQADDDSHAMAAWEINPTVTVAKQIQALRQACEKVGDVRWQDESGQEGYLHGVFRTAVFRFPDDVEFYVDTDKSVIHFRSASRVGHSDLGANRKRLKRIKKEFDELIANH